MYNKIFDKIVFSNTPPSNTNVLWIYPIDSKHYDIRMYTIVQQDEYTSIKKWTSIGITADIAKTDLSTDFWYVGFLDNIPTFDLEEINNIPVQRYEEYNTTVEDIPIIDRLLVSYVFDDLDRKNVYFDTRQVDPEKDLDKYYTVVIPDYYKINSIIKENYYEEEKTYQKDVLAEGEYLISSTLDFNGKQYTLLTLKFYDELTPFQITTNVVRDLEIKDFIVQETGNSIDKVMSQQAVSKILEEIKTTINNLPRESLITQELGNDSTKVISQKVVTDALTLKADKLSLEEAISNKLSIINLSPFSNLEFIKDSTSNGAYRTECNLSEIFNNINYKNVIFTIFDPRLVDTTTSNVIILSTGKTFCFSFVKYLKGKYYYETTVSNLEFYKEGENGVFNKYTSALITLVLDVLGNTLELYFKDANNFEKLEVEKDNYKIVISPYTIYSQHGGNNRYNTPQINLEPLRLSIGSPYAGQGAVLTACTENNGYEVEEVYLSRHAQDVDKEGIKLSDGKVKFYHNIDAGEELPINVTGIADPTTEFDAVNKRYVDLNFSKEQNTIVYTNIELSLINGYLILLDNTQTFITNSLDETLDFTIKIGKNTSLILSTGESVPSIGYPIILWLKPPYLEPNSTYVFNFDIIRGTSPEGLSISIRLGMWSKAEWV